MAGVCYRQGEEADKAFFKQLEELYRSQIKGNKSFCYHFNSKRLNKEKVGLLLNGMGDLVTVDIQMRLRYSMPSWPQSAPTKSPRPLCLETGFKENYQQWMRIESGIISENLICTNPWDQMGCIQGCRENWLVS